MKRVIAILDLPPRRAVPTVRESVEAAAERWDAELHWIRRPLQPCHPFWQKMFVCGDVAKRFGPSHVLQIDNDIVIRSDCPSPFELAQPGQFAIVAERQCAQNRIDNGGLAKDCARDLGQTLSAQSRADLDASQRWLVFVRHRDVCTHVRANHSVLDRNLWSQRPSY